MSDGISWEGEAGARCAGRRTGLANVRALVEQAIATLKSWRILLRRLRCSTTRITSLVQAILALQLTGHARAVASDVRRRADQLPKSSGPKALADVVLREAEGRLSATLEGTVRCV